ncbi:glycosyltransferase family protein [Glycomyces tarimensis]
MRVLIGADTYTPDVNGASYFTRRLAAALTPRHEVHMVAPARQVRSRTVSRDGVVEHRIRSLPIVRCSGFRFCPPVGLVATAVRVLDRVQPDVVHVQSHFPLCRAVIAAARIRGVPVVATNHFMPENLVHYLPVRGELRDRVRRWAWADAAKVFAHADVVTAPTPYAAALTESAGLRAPVRPISCGMDLARFRTGTATADFRLRYRVRQCPTIGYVGRLDLEKNLDVLVRALPVVRRRITDVQLMLVGTGDQRRRLERLATRLGVADALICTGFVADADLPAAYAAADVFVNPGTAELQSLVTLEAMASGLPVLAADASALPHLVRDGHNGYLFPPGDSAALADRLIAVLSDHSHAGVMGRRSRALAERHDVRATVGAFESIYAELTATSAPRLVAA